MTNSPNIIEFRDLTLGYGDRVLLRADGSGFVRGGFTALVGRNGTGKSTMLRTLAGLSKPLSGEVVLDGTPLREYSPLRLASSVSFVSTDEVRVPSLLVSDLVGFGRSPYTNWIGTLSEEDRRIVDRSISLVGMEAFAHKSVDTLSDGERQRVMIARALAQDTPVILLDEPTAFLDLPNRYLIGALLRKLAREEGKTIVFSSHDLTIALELCDALAVIEGGGLTMGTPEEIVAGGAIQRIFDGTSVVFDPATKSVKLK